MLFKPGSSALYYCVDMLPADFDLADDYWDNINISNTDFINVIWNIKDTHEIVVMVSIFLPVVIIGVFGNILVIHALITTPSLRSPANLLLGNMAAADLLSLLVHPWITLAYDFYQNYQLGPVGCMGESALECAIVLASVISMSAVTYDRLTAIVLPNESKMSKKGAKIIMFFTWVTGILISIPLTFYRKYKERQWKNFLEKFCEENTVIVNIYWFVIVTVLVWIPLIIQIICYVTIFVKLNKYEKIISKKLHHEVSYKKKAARMMFVVTVTFMICKMPFTAFIIYRHRLLQKNLLSGANEVRNTVNGVYHSLWIASKYLMFVNAALNPLIFGVANENFRRAFRKSKLSGWMFLQPKIKVPSVNLQQKKSKSLNETQNSGKKTIFFIFKRKGKSTDGQGDTGTSTKVEIFNTKL